MQKKAINAPMRKSDLIQVEGTKRGRGRPKMRKSDLIQVEGTKRGRGGPKITSVKVVKKIC